MEKARTKQNGNKRASRKVSTRKGGTNDSKTNKSKSKVRYIQGAKFILNDLFTEEHYLVVQEIVFKEPVPFINISKALIIKSYIHDMFLGIYDKSYKVSYNTILVYTEL